jgi:hypothetical protein
MAAAPAAITAIGMIGILVNELGDVEDELVGVVNTLAGCELVMLEVEIGSVPVPEVDPKGAILLVNRIGERNNLSLCALILASSSGVILVYMRCSKLTPPWGLLSIKNCTESIELASSNL